MGQHVFILLNAEKNVYKAGEGILLMQKRICINAESKRERVGNVNLLDESTWES